MVENVIPAHSAGPPLRTPDFDEAFSILEGELILCTPAGFERGFGRCSRSPR